VPVAEITHCNINWLARIAAAGGPKARRMPRKYARQQKLRQTDAPTKEVLIVIGMMGRTADRSSLLSYAPQWVGSGSAPTGWPTHLPRRTNSVAGALASCSRRFRADELIRV